MWQVVVVVVGVAIGGVLCVPPSPPHSLLHQNLPVGLGASHLSNKGLLPIAGPPPDLLALFHDLWHWRTQDSPELATQVGLNDNTAGRLDSLTYKHFTERKDKSDELLQRATAMDSTTPLSNTDRLNLEVVKHQLHTYIDNFKYIKYFAPISDLEGPQLHFRNMVENQMTLTSYNDFQKLLSRYGEFPRQAAELITLMETNIDEWLMPSNRSLTDALAQFESLQSPVTNSEFFKPFLHLPLSVAPEQRRTLRQQAQERITQDLLPSFNKLREFIKDRYLPRCRTETGVSKLPNGEAYYSASLRYHTSTNLSPQNIHTLGLTQVKRIQALLLQTASEVGLGSTEDVKELMEKLRQDKSQYFSSGEDLLEVFKKTVSEVVLPVMDTLFHALPPDNLTVQGSNQGSRQLGAWYERPSLDGSRPGQLYVNMKQLDLLSQHEITAAALHLSYPGHHLHAAFLHASPSTPVFRKVIGDPRVSDAPAKFPRHDAFVEGWALYSEHLGDELGLYSDPYQRLGRIWRELVAASRLVVDTGIHAFGWTWESAITYMTENTPISAKAIQDEVQRMVTWPGQGCASKIGEIKMKELRQRAHNSLGEAFSLQDFHEVVLQCTGPFKVLEDCITQFITDYTPKPEEEEKEDDMANNGGTNNAISLTTSSIDDVNTNNGTPVPRSQINYMFPLLTMAWALFYTASVIS